MAVRIERLTESDAGFWAAMRREMGPDWFTKDFDRIVREYFDRGTIQHMPHVVLLAREEEAGDAIGFAEVSLRQYAEGCESSPVGYLEGWFVAESARKRGVGAALVRAGEEWARAKGCTEFASDAEIDNELSLRAHKALGFEDLGAAHCFRKQI